MLDAIAALAPVPLPHSVYETIANSYASPGRAYHTIDHVLEVARRFDEVARAGLWLRSKEVFAAVLFHDAVYDASRTDNEAQSAELALRTLAGQPLDLPRVADFIHSTAWHGRVIADQIDDDTAHFLDADMSILGADAASFARYDQGVMAEYAPVVGELAYLAGRKAFIERVLKTPAIFLTPFFRERFENKARENLANWLREH